METLNEYNAKIDALNTAADRIMKAFIFHSRKFSSESPKAQDRLADLYQERDAVVRERNKKFRQKAEPEEGMETE